MCSWVHALVLSGVDHADEFDRVGETELTLAQPLGKARSLLGLVSRLLIARFRKVVGSNFSDSGKALLPSDRGKAVLPSNIAQTALPSNAGHAVLLLDWQVDAFHQVHQLRNFHFVRDLTNLLVAVFQDIQWKSGFLLDDLGLQELSGKVGDDIPRVFNVRILGILSANAEANDKFAVNGSWHHVKFAGSVDVRQQLFVQVVVIVTLEAEAHQSHLIPGK